MVRTFEPTVVLLMLLFLALALIAAAMWRRLQYLMRVTKDLEHCRGELVALRQQMDSLWLVLRDFMLLMAKATRDGHGQAQEMMAASLRRQLKELRRVERHVHEQIAMYGPAAAPAHLLAERERLAEYIRALEEQIDLLSQEVSHDST